MITRYFHQGAGTRLSASMSFPLPSTGRGIEGEGWDVSNQLPNFFTSPVLNEPLSLFAQMFAFSPLTLTLSPLRGEGTASVRR
jgi:hypothetical protein